MATLNTDERNLILVQALYFFGDALAGIFVTIYIFAHTSFQTVLTYTAINFVGLIFWYVLSGRIMEKISSGTLVRVGLGLNALFYLLLFVLRDSAVNYLIPLAILDGTAAGIFWSGLNLNQYVFSQQHTRVRYFAMQTTVNNSLRAAGPILGGALITVIGKTFFLGLNAAYATLFLLAAVVYSLAAAFIGKLPTHELLHFSYKKMLTHRRTFAWKMVLWEHAVFGMFDVLLGTVVGILVFVVVKQELYLGFAQTSLAIFAAIGGLIAAKLLTRYRYGFWIGAIGVTAGILGFAMLQNIWGLVWFVSVYGITSVFLVTWLLTEWFHTLDRQHIDWRQDFHVLVERDIALGLPRIISYVILIPFVGSGKELQGAWNWLYVLAVFPILLGVLFTIHGRQRMTVVPEIQL